MSTTLAPINPANHQAIILAGAETETKTFIDTMVRLGELPSGVGNADKNKFANHLLDLIRNSGIVDDHRIAKGYFELTSKEKSLAKQGPMNSDEATMYVQVLAMIANNLGNILSRNILSIYNNKNELDNLQKLLQNVYIIDERIYQSVNIFRSLLQSLQQYLLETKDSRFTPQYISNQLSAVISDLQFATTKITTTLDWYTKPLQQNIAKLVANCTNLQNRHSEINAIFPDNPDSSTLANKLQSEIFAIISDIPLFIVTRQNALAILPEYLFAKDQAIQLGATKEGETLYRVPLHSQILKHIKALKATNGNITANDPHLLKLALYFQATIAPVTSREAATDANNRKINDEVSPQQPSHSSSQVAAVSATMTESIHTHSEFKVALPKTQHQDSPTSTAIATHNKPAAEKQPATKSWWRRHATRLLMNIALIGATVAVGILFSPAALAVAGVCIVAANIAKSVRDGQTAKISNIQQLSEAPVSNTASTSAASSTTLMGNTSSSSSDNKMVSSSESKPFSSDVKINEAITRENASKINIASTSDHKMIASPESKSLSSDVKINEAITKESTTKVNTASTSDHKMIASPESKSLSSDVKINEAISKDNTSSINTVPSSSASTPSIFSPTSISFRSFWEWPFSIFSKGSTSDAPLTEQSDPEDNIDFTGTFQSR